MKTKERIKYSLIGIILGVLFLGATAAAVNIGWTVGTSALGTIMYPNSVNLVGIPMQPGYITSATATTTAGTLATSSVITYQFSNVASGALATSTVPLTYYFEISANDQIGGQTLPSAEMSTGVSSTATSNEVILNWAPIQGALYYDVYIATSSQSEGIYATTTATTFTVSTTTVSTTTGISVGIPQTINTAYVDSINPNGSVKFSNNFYVNTIDGLGTATIATGTGAGSSPTETTTYANGVSAVFQLKTGTNPSSTAPIVTITFPYVYPKAPSCDFQAENSTTAALNGTSTPYVIDSSTSTILESNVGGLAASTAYAWGMQCQN